MSLGVVGLVCAGLLLGQPPNATAPDPQESARALVQADPATTPSASSPTSEPGEPGVFREAPAPTLERPERENAPVTLQPPPSPSAPPVAAPNATRPPPPEDGETAEDSGPKYAAWTAVGLGVAMAVAGGIFAARTVSAIDDIPATPKNLALTATFEDDLESAQQAVLVNGLATSVLISGATASLITGSLLLVAD